MKLAVFARALVRRPTGRGAYVAEMLRALAAAGVELDVFAGEPVDLPGCRFWPARGRSPAGSAWRVLRGIGRDLRRIAPDLLWCATHFVPHALPHGLPVVATVLDLVWRDHPATLPRRNRWAAAWMEEGLHRADRIVCISEFTRERLTHYWPHLRPRTAVVHLAPNPRLAALADDASVLGRLGVERPFVLAVGTVEPRKNLGLVLDAMALLPGVPLVHCGPAGWNVGGLEERLRRTHDVHRLGWVEEPVLATLYRHARAAVFPSIYEGFDLPALDAASLGCPLVVSDIPVHREVLGDAALYAPANDAPALAERLRSLIDSDEARQGRSRLVRARAARFSWGRAAQSLCQVFDGMEAAGMSR